MSNELTGQQAAPVSGVLGTKLGMTQVWDEDGKLVPVTVVPFKTSCSFHVSVAAFGWRGHRLAGSHVLHGLLHLALVFAVAGSRALGRLNAPCLPAGLICHVGISTVKPSLDCRSPGLLFSHHHGPV